MADEQTTDQDDAILAKADEIRAQRAAEEKQREDDALAAKRALYAPLNELLASDTFATMQEKLTAARDALLTPDTMMVYGWLNSLLGAMDTVAKHLPADVRQPAPEPAPAS